MASENRRISVPLDDDLVSDLKAGGEPPSIPPSEVGRQRRLAQMLDELEARHGPPDERTVRKYLDLLA